MSDDEYVTKADTRQIAQEAADRAVRNMVRELGIDADDYQTVEEWRSTLQWAKKAKQGSDQITTNIRKGITWGAATAVGTGLVYLLWRAADVVSKTKGGS